MLITEAEMIMLITASTNERGASYRFGPGWIRLEDCPSNKWAIEMVKAKRAREVNSDGK